MGRLTDRQYFALKRLAENDYVSFTGHLRAASGRLAKSGLATDIGPDKWTGRIFQITDAGRAALAEHGEGK